MLLSSNIFLFWICCLIPPSHWIMAQLFKAWLYTSARETLHFLCPFSPSWTLSPQAHFLYFLRGGWESYSLLFSSIQNTLLPEDFKGTKVYLNLLWALGRNYLWIFHFLTLSTSSSLELLYRPYQSYWEECPCARVYQISWDWRI